MSRRVKSVSVSALPRAGQIFTEAILGEFEGRLAQRFRAPGLHPGCHRFESYIAHHGKHRRSKERFYIFLGTSDPCLSFADLIGESPHDKY